MTNEVEEIFDEDLLYRRIHVQYVKKSLSPDAFDFRGDGCSVDLARLTTPESTRSGSPRNPPECYKVGVLEAGKVRGIGLTLDHCPEPDNPAHSLILPPGGIEAADILGFQTELVNLCLQRPLL